MCCELNGFVYFSFLTECVVILLFFLWFVLKKLWIQVFCSSFKLLWKEYFVFISFWSYGFSVMYLDDINSSSFIVNAPILFFFLFWFLGVFDFNDSKEVNVFKRVFDFVNNECGSWKSID